MQRHRWLLAGGLLLCGALAGAGLWLGPGRPASGPLLAGAAALLVVVVAGYTRTVLRRLFDVAQRLERMEADLYALSTVRPVLGALPVPLGGYAADPVFARNIVELILRRRPGLIVELGSGSSSVVAGRMLELLGHGRVLSFDHEETFAEATRKLVEAHGLSHRVSVITAPLMTRSLMEKPWRWYSEAVEDAIDGPIDMLIVDGPPGNLGARARFPAMVLLSGRLADEGVVLLDDGDRPDEEWIANEWARFLGGRALYLPGGRGGWLVSARAS